MAPPNIGSSELLFDTQTVIYWAKNKAPKSVELSVLSGARVHVSIVSFWEFVLKSSYNNIGISFVHFTRIVEALEAHVLPIAVSHLQTLSDLPILENHRDPFDRLIISQAISEGLVLAGGDSRFPSYQETQIGKNLVILWKDKSNR